MSSNNRLLQIWIKRARRGPMDSRSQAQLIAGRGLVDNSDQGGKRQVTIVSREAWETAQADLGEGVDPVARRANLLVSGVELENSRGKVLQIGEARILIHGETRPCERMDEACPGLRSALDPHWRAGAYGEVVLDAEIHIGDSVSWQSAE